MPEGPSIVILKEAALPLFKGKKIISASGNAKIEIASLINKKIIDFKSWGKHFLICLADDTIKIHFLMFGSYAINEQKHFAPRLHLQFKNGELNVYNCSVKLLGAKADDIYDWSSDVMSNDWNAQTAKEKLKMLPEMLVCDALLDQNIFAGVGNIIKNEVLFRIKIHPNSKIGKLPDSCMDDMIKEARDYSFDFLKWKKAFDLKSHWLVHAKKICPRCNIPIQRKNLGEKKRRAFYCNNCQVLY